MTYDGARACDTACTHSRGCVCVCQGAQCCGCVHVLAVCRACISVSAPAVPTPNPAPLPPPNVSSAATRTFVPAGATSTGGWRLYPGFAGHAHSAFAYLPQGTYRAPTWERSPEVCSVMTAMGKLGCDLFVDVHGDGDIPATFFLDNAGIPGWTPRLQRLHNAFSDAMLVASPNFQTELGMTDRPDPALTRSVVPNRSAFPNKCSSPLTQTQRPDDMHFAAVGDLCSRGCLAHWVATMKMKLTNGV